MPNDTALGALRLQYYATTTNANLGVRQMLQIYGIPYMEATATNLGDAMQYEILQAGGSALTFKIPVALPAGGTGYITGLPVGGSAFSQARVSFIMADGTAANKATAAYLRQYRAGDGYVDYPVAGGRAARFTTDAGRTFVFPAGGIEVIRDRTNGTLVVNGSRTDGTLRQVKTLGGLLDIVPVGARNFEIRKYAPAQVSPKVAGLWTANGAPIAVMNVNAPANTQNAVTIVNSRGSVTYSTTHTVAMTPDGAGEVWLQENTNGPFQYQRKLERHLLPSFGAGYRKTKWTASIGAAPGLAGGGGGAPDYVLETTTKDYFPLTSVESFKSGLVKRNTAAYNTPAWDPTGTAGPASQTNDSGTGISYQYNGAQQMISRTFTRGVPGGGGTAPQVRKESYSYTPLAGGDALKVFDFRPRTTTTTLDGQTASVTYDSYTTGGSYVVVHETAATPTSAYGDARNLRREMRYFGAGANQGRLQQVRSGDGTLTTYDYAALSGGGLQITTLNQLSLAGVPVSGYSTRRLEVLDARGWPVDTTTGHWTGAVWVDAEKITQAYDNFGNLTSQVRTDLRSNQTRTLLDQQWDGPNLLSRVDETGVTTTYEYFPGTKIVQRERRAAVPAAGTNAAQPEIVTTYSGTFALDADQFPVWAEQTTTARGSGWWKLPWFIPPPATAPPKRCKPRAGSWPGSRARNPPSVKAATSLGTPPAASRKPTARRGPRPSGAFAPGAAMMQ